MTVSPDAATFHRSVRLVEKELDKKRDLSKREIQLSNEVRQIKFEDPRTVSEQLRLIDSAHFKGGGRQVQRN